MKKIKYGNRKNETGPPLLANLKQDDEICEAVLDTLSDDYLNYIGHLVKHSKTPVKNRASKEQEQPSSDSQPFELIQPQQTFLLQRQRPPKQELRTRHHSETGTKSVLHRQSKEISSKHNPKDCIEQLPRKHSYQKDKETISRHKPDKHKQKEHIRRMEDELLRHGQKTMSFTRNHNPFAVPPQQEPSHKLAGLKNKIHTKSKPKCYTNYQEYQEISHDKMSIGDNLPPHIDSQRQSQTYPFINDLDNYLSHLEENQQQKQIKLFSASRKNREKSNKQTKMFDKKRLTHVDEDYSEYDVHELLKENLKLHKKVKHCEEKIEEFQQEISSHLIQCKTRDKNHKGKISQLVKALTQAVSKINAQKSQITSMKSFLKSFGKKVKQLEHQEDQESDQEEEDISESIIRYLGTQKQGSELRTKQKRGLESTMPKYQDDRHFWRQ